MDCLVVNYFSSMCFVPVEYLLGENAIFLCVLYVFIFCVCQGVKEEVQ